MNLRPKDLALKQCVIFLLKLRPMQILKEGLCPAKQHGLNMVEFRRHMPIPRGIMGNLVANESQK